MRKFWSNPKPDPNPLAEALSRAKEILKAETSGREAWMLLALNHTLAENYRNSRRYRWTIQDLNQMIGGPPL